LERSQKDESNHKKINKILGKLSVTGIEIEPGESEQLHYDFLVDKAIKTVLVYSYFQNIQKNRRLGWSLTTTNDFTSLS
jgi:hypothetical protein